MDRVLQKQNSPNLDLTSPTETPTATMVFFTLRGLNSFYFKDPLSPCPKTSPLASLRPVWVWETIEVDGHNEGGITVITRGFRHIEGRIAGGEVNPAYL